MTNIKLERFTLRGHAMTMKYTLAALCLLALTTGCRKKEAVALQAQAINAANPCTYTHVMYVNCTNNCGMTTPFSDHIVIPTGAVNGDDGYTEVVQVCASKGVGCLTFNSTSVSPDGVLVEFSGTNVIISLAASKGYGYAQVAINRTCN